jgi:hypothetical protein
MMQQLAWHFDFHSHEQIRIGHDPDVEGMARELAAAGVGEIITFAKCHTGFAYYPSKCGTPHPKMKGDCFGDVVRACKAAGIEVLAYLSFGIDGEAGRRHPEYAQVHDRAKGPNITKDHFVSTCPFTPYIDELMLPMIQEILDGYDVDGFFFDTMGAMGICHCEYCEAEYRGRFGKDIPASPADPDWGQYGAFRRERAWRVVEHVGKYITDQKPGAKVGFNWVGTVRFPEKMPEGVTCLTCDYSTTGPQSLQASFHASYSKTADHPADVMYTIINNGWRDWAPRPLPGLEQTGLPIWAHGCRPYLGDRFHPTNRLDPMSVRAIRFMGDVQRRVAAEYPGPDAHQVSEITMLIGPEGIYGGDLRRFAADHSGVVPIEGMHHLLLDAGHCCAIVAEAFLASRLSETKLFLLAGNEGIAPASDRQLKEWVEAGGTLLVCGGVPKVDGKPMDWLGVVREDAPWQDHIYLPLLQADPEKSPALVHGNFHKIAVTDAEVVLEAIQPYDCSHGMRFGHATGPVSFTTSGVPALTRRNLGKGQVYYLEASIGTDYYNLANYWQADWFRTLLETLLPRPLARVVSEAGTVEVVPHTDGKTTWAFLINHGGEQQTFTGRTVRTFAQVPPFPVTLEIAAPAGRQPASATIAGQPVAYEFADGIVRIPQICDSIWRVVRVDWR